MLESEIMIKKFLGVVLITIMLYSCEEPHPSNYMSISGTFDNITERDTVLFVTGFAVRKKIKINPDGSFQDSLKIAKPNYHSVMFRNQRAVLWLKNGYDIRIKGDANNFFRSFEFEGDSEGAHSNEFILNQFEYSQANGKVKDFVLLEEEAFLKKIEEYKNDIDSIADIYENMDSELLKKTQEQNERFTNNLKENYDSAHEHYGREAAAEERLKSGKIAPEFSDFENFKGGKSSLSDFRGKYVYIDVWATWCRPCIAQIPYLKRLQERYEGKNIEFLSISTDDDRRSGGSWNEARKRWRAMVKDKNLKGTHLWAGKEHIQFGEDYWIQGIPRFILIDPEGKLIEANAPRPVDPKITDIFDELLQ